VEITASKPLIGGPKNNVCRIARRSSRDDVSDATAADVRLMRKTGGAAVPAETGMLLTTL